MEDIKKIGIGLICLVILALFCFRVARYSQIVGCTIGSILLLYIAWLIGNEILDTEDDN